MDEHRHEPDWDTMVVSHDHGVVYVDVNCKHCGTSGCVGSTETLQILEDFIDW